MDRGYLRKADPRVTALQFTALVTAEIGLRVYQRDPPRVAIRQIRQMAFHEGTRKNDAGELMRSVASRLNEADIAAVSGYFASIHIDPSIH
jgi:hypothetical protein